MLRLARHRAKGLPVTGLHPPLLGERMEFRDKRLVRHARAQLRRRRGWVLIGVALLGWLVLIALGYGLWRLVQSF